MNFPPAGAVLLGCPWPSLPGHGGGSHPFFYVRRHAGRKRPRKDIPSLAGKRPACLAGDGLLSVPVASRDSSGPAWKKKTSVCVLFFPLPFLEEVPGGVCKRCTWLVRARQWGCAAPALVAVAVFTATVFFRSGFCPVSSSPGWVGYLGRGGRMRPRGDWRRAARDGWICFGMTGYHPGLLKGRVCRNP